MAARANTPDLFCSIFQKQTLLYGRRASLSQLPQRLQTEECFRRHPKRLPEKYLFANFASKITLAMAYRENREADFLGMLEEHLQRSFGDHLDRTTT